MPKIPITRQQAIELLKKYPQTESDFNHYLMSEAVMKELALKLNEEVEYWSMLGLLHDIDWSVTKENVKQHGTKAPEILRELNFSEEFIDVVLSHIYGYNESEIFKNKKRAEKIEFALAASETITGLIYAYALMRGRKISDMDVKGLKKKFKDKTFASGCDREIIKEIEKTGLSLDEFFEIAIKGIKNIKDEIGLG